MTFLIEEENQIDYLKYLKFILFQIKKCLIYAILNYVICNNLQSNNNVILVMLFIDNRIK